MKIFIVLSESLEKSGTLPSPFSCSKGIHLKWIYQCTIAQQILVNKVKLCTLTVQHDVQLEIFCWSIKDCQSQAS